MTREEVIEILSTENVRNIFNWPAIPNRLAQAIPGMVCPMPINSHLEAKVMKLDRVMADVMKTGATAKMIDDIMALIS